MDNVLLAALAIAGGYIGAALKTMPSETILLPAVGEKPYSTMVKDIVADAETLDSPVLIGFTINQLIELRRILDTHNVSTLDAIAILDTELTQQPGEHHVR